MSLPKPMGIQIEVLDLPAIGHNVILGTAGSGKTTLAIYRALALSKLNLSEKILIVTFNKTLVKYFKAIADIEISNIDVLNYHKFARGYLKSRGKMPNWNGIVSGFDDGESIKLSMIREGKKRACSIYGNNSTLKRADRVFLEEINWIEKRGISSLEEYEKVERIGRLGTRITRDNRRYFYKVYEEYKSIRSAKGYLYDWEDIAQAVYKELSYDNEKRMYKHIVIDEGQDLSPMMLKSLAKAIPENGSLTFFGDVAQQIYGGRISWRDAGLKIDKKKIWRFDRNYRNSKEIAKLAMAISKSPYFSDVTDLVEPVMPTASSPLPALVRFQSENQELEWMVKTAIKSSNHQTVAILLRDRESVELLNRLLKNKKVYPQVLKSDMCSLDVNANISIGTYHSAKGLEFDMVLLPYCSDERLPCHEAIEAFESREEAFKEEIKLIYVAITRAKTGLILSYTGKPTELLPENSDNLYDERDGIYDN